jgi:hypothetical protein
LACEKEYKKRWWQESKHNHAEQRKHYAEENREKLLAQRKKFREENAEKVSSQKKRACAKNKAHYRKRGAINAAKRRAAKLQSIPVWANFDAIEKFYESARGLSMLLGEWYHVDHIVPLKSPYVCGLHCEHNMQILTQFENFSKNNRWWPDMWEPVPLEEITNGL